MRRRGGISILIIAFACFILQWLLLGLVFKNLRTLSLWSKRPFSPSSSTLYILSTGSVIVSMILTNNWLLPEDTDNERTALTMLGVFNAESCVVLIATHFVIGFMRKEKKQ